MRRLLTLMLIFVAVPFVQAQSLDAFKEHLAAPVTSETTLGPVRVVVTEHGDAATAVDRAERSSSKLRVRGYRVCIFFDNGQNARAGAEAALVLFGSSFPGVRAYKVYESPYFKVSVGNCLTAEEAIVLKGRVSSTFPKAFIKNEEFPITDLLN